MAFEPKNITKDHVLKAVERIKKNKIELIPSRIYYVEIDGINYPPKEIMRYAHEEMNGEYLWDYSGGEPTNKFLKGMGFTIIEEDKSNDPIVKLIERYKERNKETRMADEIYKWIKTQRFHHRPDTSASNFFEEITSIDYDNLIYPVAKTVIKHIASERPVEFRSEFIKLFNEEENLLKRVNDFSTDTFKIYRDIDPDNTYSHHQDERTISSYLAFYDSDRYPLFKDSFYQKYCKIIGVKPKPKGHKYIHYIEILHNLIDDYIIPDQELLELKAQCVPKEGSEDKSHYLLAQDILYQMLDKSVARDRRYWRIGTTNKDQKYWDVMLKERYASIGWSDFGDLSEQDIKSKSDIIRLFDELGYYIDKPSVKSRKAGEVIDFYSEIKIGDVILAQDGQKVNGIGIVKDDYLYNKGLPFPHTRIVDWVIIDPHDLYNGSGLQTTVYKLKDPTLINKIDELLSVNNLNVMKKEYTLNTILYGPPGTGKTYHTVDLAVKIASPEKYIEGNHEENKKIYDNLIKQGQIVFTTFHQSMSYEDFIEGIKPLKPEGTDTFLKYDVEDGIFKKICAAAVTPNQIDFNTAFNKLQVELTEKDIIDLKTPTGKVFSISLNRNGNLNLHTGENKNQQGTLTKENIQKQISGDNVFEYWQGYFTGVIDYLKTRFAYNPKGDKTEQNFVLIIDEINRGNVAEIFGELITLIEYDKREGMKEAIKVLLPYSKKEFSVPANLYILGTMNTADRNVEALDTALRRRFSFVEMHAKPELLRPSVILQRLWIKYADLKWADPKWKKLESDFLELHGAEILDRKIYEQQENYVLNKDVSTVFDGIIRYSGFNLEKLINTLNVRIEKLLDNDHEIGHSYLMSVYSWEELKFAFYNKIIPLLQEYFYGDYEKLGLVLGEGFIRSIKSEKDVFAKFPVEDLEIYDKPIFHINSDALDPNQSITVFKNALNILMKNIAESE